MKMEPLSKKFSQFYTEEEESRRIAHELHHNVAQSLSAMELDLRKGTQQIRDGQITTGIETLEAVIPNIQRAIQRVQAIGMSIWPPPLDDLGILSTLSWFCREYERAHPKITVSIHTGIEEKEVPGFLRHTIYTITKEALNNIAGPGKADLISVSLLKRNETVELTIQNNVEAFDKEGASPDPMSLIGLYSMRARTEMTGGSFMIEPAVEKGTVIRASWPIEPSSL